MSETPPALPPDDRRLPRPGGLSRHFRRHSGDEPPAVPAGEKEAPTAEADEDIDLLTEQLRSLVARKKARERAETEPPPPAPAEASRGSASGRRGKALARSGNVNLAGMLGHSVDATAKPEHASAAGPTTRPTAAPAEAAPPGRAEPPSPPAPARPPFRRAFSDLPPPRRPGLAWLVGLGALALGGVGFWLGHLSVPAPRAPAAPAAASLPPLPETWRDKAVADLDAAMKADRAGDLATALRDVRALRDANPNLPGVKLYAAELAVRHGEHVQAESELALMVDAREDIARAFYLRAFNFGRQRKFPESFRALQAALVLDPFNVDGLYEVGELLRRQGQFKDAVELFEQALLRARPGHGLALETIGLKLRLALIEAGRGAEAEAALAEANKTPPLSAEWQFTAAALAVQRADWPAAAAALRQAREMMPRDAFQWFVDDYFFRNAATTQPAMAEFRVPEEDRARRSAVSWEFFVDP